GSDYVFTLPRAGSDRAIDSDPEANPSSPDYGWTPAFDVVVGPRIKTIDAGIVPRDTSEDTATIGDTAWVDKHPDGVRQTDELGLAGVSVTLLDAAGAVVGMPQATDSDGHYEFTGLAPGEYTVKFEPPSGYSPNTVSYTVRVVAGAVRDDIDAGFVPELSGSAKEDRNGNGTEDLSDPGI